MEEFMTQIQPIIINAAIVVLTSIGSFVGIKVKQFIDDKVNTETKKRIVKTTCQYVEQVYKDSGSEAKLEKAKENILNQLNEQGITISDLELRVLIESTVNSFTKEINKSTLVEDSTDKDIRNYTEVKEEVSTNDEKAD